MIEAIIRLQLYKSEANRADPTDGSRYSIDGPDFGDPCYDSGGCRSLYRLPCRVDHAAGVDRIHYGCALTPLAYVRRGSNIASHHGYACVTKSRGGMGRRNVYSAPPRYYKCTATHGTPRGTHGGPQGIAQQIPMGGYNTQGGV